jgi:hypothetical protein
MPGAEGLGGGSPEFRAATDQAPVSQGYGSTPETESFENRVDGVMRQSGMRLTRAEAEDHVRDADAYVSRVEQELSGLRDERDEAIAGKEDREDKDV